MCTATMLNVYSFVIVLSHMTITCGNVGDELSSSCPTLWNTSNVHHPPRWSSYSTLIIHHLMTKGTSTQVCQYNQFNLWEFMYRLERCSLSIWRRYMGEKIAFDTKLTSPLKLMYFASRNSTSHRWLIQVHKTFMINVTVFKAYVPFTDLCSPHTVGVYEGHEAMNDTLIEKFCGHVSMETVYTKHNKGLLRIQAFADMLLLPISIQAQYEIHEQGAAYRFGSKHSCWPSASTLSPSLIIRMASRLHYYWYFSQLEFYAYNTAPSHVRLTIHTCIAQHSTRIAVYPGLLSHFWRQWRVRHYTTQQCNITGPQKIDLNFHLYATIYVNVAISDQIFSIKMTFIYNTLTTTNLDVLHSNALQFGHITLFAIGRALKSFKFIGTNATMQAFAVIRRKYDKYSSEVRIPHLGKSISNFYTYILFS